MVADDVWDDLSRRYERQLWLERAAVREALDLLAPGPDDHLLDLATGTGEVLRQLARRDRRPRSAIGVDSSPAMLARAATPPAGWSLRQADARSLPFAAAEFDAISAAYLLHVVAEADLHAILAEARRVLRPGGRMVTVTPAIPGRWPARPLARALDRLAAAAPRLCCGLRALDPRSALERAGLEIEAHGFSLRGYPSLCVLARR